MTITRHPFRGEADMIRVLDLLHAMPSHRHHILDLPWRLTSPAIQEGRDAAFWVDEQSRVVGLAAWQYYWATLDLFLLPGSTRQELEAGVFAWAEQRFRERDAERGEPLPYWIEFRDDDQETRQLAERHGFLFNEHDCNAFFQHMLNDLAPVPALPDGFSLRSLAGLQEIAAYAEVHRVAFESDSMTTAWRARTLSAPQYRSELDLVIVAPSGELAGFCVGWFDADRRMAHVEPIGVHPQFRRCGLARSLLLEMLHRFKALGALRAQIEPRIDNTPIHRVCESVGFALTHHVRCIGKWVSAKP